MSPAASFSVVVVLHDSEAELHRLLESLSRLPAPAPELIVVDSGSTDGGLELARRHGATAIELEGNPGFGAATNAGVARSSSPVTVLLNPDIELLDGGLAELARRARVSDALHAPRLLDPDGSVQPTAHPTPGRLGPLLAAAVPAAALPARLRRLADPSRASTSRPVGWAIAACLAARTETLRGLGPFDPSVFLFYEDLDLCLRAKGAGVATLLHPDVAVRHTGRHSVTRAFAGEPFDLLARRRREAVARLGRRALALDDAAQALTFTSRWLAKRAVGRDAERERQRLRALRAARAQKSPS